jgi:hypothetical protein
MPMWRDRLSEILRGLRANLSMMGGGREAMKRRSNLLNLS